MPGDLIRQTYPEAERKTAPEVWLTHAAFYGGKCSKKRETQKGMVKGVPRGEAGADALRGVNKRAWDVGVPAEWSVPSAGDPA